MNISTHSLSSTADQYIVRSVGRFYISNWTLSVDRSIGRSIRNHSSTGLQWAVFMPSCNHLNFHLPSFISLSHRSRKFKVVTVIGFIRLLVSVFVSSSDPPSPGFPVSPVPGPRSLIGPRSWVHWDPFPLLRLRIVRGLVGRAGQVLRQSQVGGTGASSALAPRFSSVRFVSGRETSAPFAPFAPLLSQGPIDGWEIDSLIV